MSVVAITGISGYLGQRLFEVLAEDSDVERVVGIDVEDPQRVSPKLEFHRIDVRAPEVAKALPGVDVLVHLAFVLNPMRDERLMHDINVHGTRNVLEAVASASVPRLVYTSSATVYGAHPDNDMPLTERSPIRANADFAYSAHKLETEVLLAAFAARHSEVSITVFRPALVFGPNVENFISRTFEAPRIVSVRGYRPSLQFVHEEDVAAALALAVRRPMPGVFNVAPDGWLTFEQIRVIAGRTPLELPEGVAFSLADRLWRAGASASPPGELHFIMHPWVVSNERLKSQGWTPAYSNEDALRLTLEAHKEWLTLGRARMRKSDLARGAVATLGAVGTMALARRVRKKRRARS